jgi:hypothetical protein
MSALNMPHQYVEELAAPMISLILLIAGWILFAIPVSYMSGWHHLAKVYRASQPQSGERFRPWAASMRWNVNYNGMLSVAAGPQGLYLSMIFLFRPGHPPLFIPWADISATVERRWWFTLAKLRFKGYDSTFLLIPLKLAQKLSTASGFQFQVEQGVVRRRKPTE